MSMASCCNKNQVELNRYMLSDEEKQWVPYQAGQDLTFEYSNGNELNFHVDKRETFMERMGGEHCGEGYISYEKLEAEIYSDSPYMLFNLSMQAQEFSEHYLSIVFNSHQEFFQLDIDSAPDYASIDINGYTFENVYELESQQNNSTGIVPKIIFYNKTDGIIQIILTDDETISLKK